MTTRLYLGGGGDPQQEAAVWRLFPLWEEIGS